MTTENTLQPKTIHEWFEEGLKEPAKSRAIAQTDPQVLTEQAESLSEAIHTSFDWKATGDYDFWLDVATRIDAVESTLTK